METKSIRSLIIDDDPFIQNLLKDMLDFHFPKLEVVDTANNGSVGIEMIKKEQPDLIFLDVEMADMTGFEVLTHFEEDSFQTIFITSYDHYAIKALRMNALDYLVKPIVAGELKQAIDKFRLKAKNKERNETIKQTVNSLEKLILNILPKEIAEEIQTQGGSSSKRHELVSVLFTDIKGFTQHANRLSPEELVEDLNEYYSAFDLILEKFGVEKIKTIGDAYMAAGGIPVSNTSNPRDTVHAAIAIQEYISVSASRRKAIGKIPFEFRIGIHTGPVVAGIVGIRKFAYDIWGDTVNIAARMEEAGAINKINISQSTYELIKGYAEFSFTARGRIQTKGKGKLAMYFVEPKQADLPE